MNHDLGKLVGRTVAGFIVQETDWGDIRRFTLTFKDGSTAHFSAEGYDWDEDVEIVVDIQE